MSAIHNQSLAKTLIKVALFEAVLRNGVRARCLEGIYGLPVLFYAFENSTSSYQIDAYQVHVASGGVDEDGAIQNRQDMYVRECQA